MDKNTMQELEKLGLDQYIDQPSNTYPNIINAEIQGEWLVVEYLQLSGFIKEVSYLIER